MRQLFDLILYINLARRRDRRRVCEEEIAKLGWTRTQRMEAVDANGLSVKYWVERGVIAAEASHLYTRGMYACIASHYLAWQAVLESDAPEDAWCLILEDDFRAHPLLVERPDVFRGYWAALPPDAGFVLLGCIRDSDDQLLDVGVPLNRFVVQLKDLVFSSHAYAVTKEFVRKNISIYFPLEYVMDCFHYKMRPLYALRSIDEGYWNCKTPPNFYSVSRECDAAPSLSYAGIFSVYPSPSDIQYGRNELEERLALMRENMHQGNHVEVCRMAKDVKIDLMRELYPDLYLLFLDICITSFWYVRPQQGEDYVGQLLRIAIVEPQARQYLKCESSRLLPNLGFYAERYLQSAKTLVE